MTFKVFCIPHTRGHIVTALCCQKESRADRSLSVTDLFQKKKKKIPLNLAPLGAGSMYVASSCKRKKLLHCSCSPQLPIMLSFTYLQCSTNSPIPTLCPIDHNSYRSDFPKKVPSLSFKTLREFLPQDVFSRSFLFHL